MPSHEQLADQLSALMPTITSITKLLYNRHAVVRQIGAVEDAVQSASLAVWRRLVSKPLPEPTTYQYLKVLIRRSLVRAAFKSALVRVDEETCRLARGTPGATDALRALCVRGLADGGCDLTEEEPAEPDEEAERKAKAQMVLIEEGLAALSDVYRQAVVLYYGLCGQPRMGARQAAKFLGVSRTAFLRRVQYGRERLKTELVRLGVTATWQ